MPYNVLANMDQAGMLKSPFESFMEGRQQKFQNALAQQQADQSAQELAMKQKQLDDAQKQHEQVLTEAAQKKQLEEAYAGALRVINSQSPLATAQQLFPDTVAGLRQQGHALSSDDEVRAFAQQIADRSGMALGLAPPAPKSNDPGELVQIIGPNGQPVLVPRAQAVNQRPYIKPDKPEKASEPASAQLVTRPNPDGTVQDFAFDPKTRELSPVGSPYKKGSDVTPKDINTARQKMVQLAVARKQIEDIKERFKESVGVSQGAFGQGILPTVSGKKFDAAVDAIRSTFSGLTRVPGIGAMSDWEGKLAQQPLPNRNDYEAVTAQKIQQIDDLVSRLEAEYGKVLKEDSQPSEGGPNGLGVGQTATIGGAKVTRVK